MTRLDVLLLVSLLLFVSACSDAAMVTDSGEPTSENLVLHSDTIAITSLGDTLTPKDADIEYLGRPARVGEVRFELVRETRWLEERAVLEASPLGEGLLVATGPGTVRARVLATSQDLPEELTVTVAPTRPVATSIQDVRVDGGGVQGTLRGYWSEDEPIEVSAGTARGEATYRDSANLDVRFPSEPFDGSDGGCSGSGLLPIHVTGGDVFGTVRIPSPTSRPGTVHLEPGEHVKGQIEAEGASREDACLKLVPVPGARYVLAYGDGSRAARAADGFEGNEPGQFKLTVADRSQPGDSTTTSSALATPTSSSVSFAPGHLTTSLSAHTEASDACREGWLHAVK